MSELPEDWEPWGDSPVLRPKSSKKKRKNNLARSTRTAVYRRDGKVCRYCGVVTTDPPIPGETQEPTTRTIDHVLPVAKGGKDTTDNLVVSCAQCNMVKGDRTPEEAGMVLLAPPKQTQDERPEHLTQRPFDGLRSALSEAATHEAMFRMIADPGGWMKCPAPGCEVTAKFAALALHFKKDHADLYAELMSKPNGEAGLAWLNRLNKESTPGTMGDAHNRKEDQMTAERSFPLAPSNRRLLKQLELWGATIEKTRGDWSFVRLPDGELVTLRAAHTHTGNSAKDISDVVRKVAPGFQEFWDRTEKVKSPAPKKDASKKEPVLAKVAPSAPVIPLTPVPPKEAPMPVPERTPRGPDRAPRKKGIQPRIVGSLMKLGGMGTIDQIHEDLPDLTRDQITKGAYSLATRSDLVTKVSTGVWRLNHVRDEDFRVGIHVNGGEQQTVAAPQPHPPLPHLPLEPEPAPPEPEPEPAPAPVRPFVQPTGLDDETIYAVLDLILPEGFQAKHLPAILRWTNATEELMKEVRG